MPRRRLGGALATVESELGAPVAALYGSFHRPVMASASVAEVHKATLKDHTRVVVKVVHHDAAARVRADLDVMRVVAEWLERSDADLERYRLVELVDGFAAMLRDALDLRTEAANLEAFGAKFADDPRIAIPHAYRELSSASVLTMTREEGRSPTGREAVERAGWEVDDLVEAVADVYLTMIFRDGLFHADPHPGNLLLTPITASRSSTSAMSGVCCRRGARSSRAWVSPSSSTTTGRSPTRSSRSPTRRPRPTSTPRAATSATGSPDRSTARSTRWMCRRSPTRSPRSCAAMPAGPRRPGPPRPHRPASAGPRAELRLAGRSALAHRAARGAPMQQTLEALRAGRIAVEFRFHDEDRVTESLVGGIVAGSSILAASQLLSRRAAVRADTRRGRSRGQPRVASAASSSSRMRAQASTSSGVPDSSNSNSTGRPDFSASSRAAAW